MIRLAIFVLSTIITVLFFAATAIGEPISFGFSGVVTYVPSELTSEFSMGESLNGYYTFESTTPGPNVPVSLAFYTNAITEFGVTFGGDYTLSDLTTVETNTSTTRDDDDIAIGVTPSLYHVIVRKPIAENVGEFRLFAFYMGFVDLDGTVFDSTALPLVPFDLEEFELTIPSGLEFFSPEGDSIIVGFRPNTLTLIPEPTTTALALVAMLFAARRRRIFSVKR